VAVTDTNNLFLRGIFRICSQAGVQPIIGCQVDLGLRVDEQGGVPSGLPLVFWRLGRLHEPDEAKFLPI
jgi:DNA polymerase-3 subunit alpha